MGPLAPMLGAGNLSGLVNANGFGGNLNRLVNNTWNQAGAAPTPTVNAPYVGQADFRDSNIAPSIHSSTAGRSGYASNTGD